MLDRLIAKSKTEASDLKASPGPEKTFTYEVLDTGVDRSGSAGDLGPKAPSQTWNFSNIPLFPKSKDGDSSCVAGNAEPEAEAENTDGEGDVSASNKSTHDARSCSDTKCSICAGGGKDRARAASDAAPVAMNKCSANNEEAACNCQKCGGASDLATDHQAARDGTPAPAPAPAPTFTYTFMSRGSYGETAGNFTAPRCLPGGRGSAVLQAGVARPAVTVFPNGTYRVRRNDGVVQNATCRRLAAGLAATRTHENSHAAGARRGVADANRAATLPRNFATAAECTAAAPGIITAYNAVLDPVWQNEITHGPGTNPPTAQTFNEENAAGTCTFS
jgi:hypothetical protein